MSLMRKQDRMACQHGLAILLYGRACNIRELMVHSPSFDNLLWSPHSPDHLTNDEFVVELSSRSAELDMGEEQLRKVKPDEHWNDAQCKRDEELQQRKKRAEVDRTRRVIKHPNFHNFNPAQAEAFLEQHQTGDVVIRPSSKGANYLAVTWKGP